MDWANGDVVQTKWGAKRVGLVVRTGLDKLGAETVWVRWVDSFYYPTACDPGILRHDDGGGVVLILATLGYAA